MKLLAVVGVLILALAAAQDNFFIGCTLDTVAGVTNPSLAGTVGCMFGVTGTNWTLACSLIYEGFQSPLNDAEIYVSDANSNYYGQVLDFAPIIAGLSGGTTQTGFFAANFQEQVLYVNADGNTPATQSVVLPANTYNTSWGAFAVILQTCGNGTNLCRLTMKTTGHPMGEATCALTGLTYGAEFNVPLMSNLTTHPNSQAYGNAMISWRVTTLDWQTTPYSSIWAYQVNYDDMAGFVASSGIFNAEAAFPAVSFNAPEIAFDINGAIAAGGFTGAFCGVAIQGMVGTGTNGDTSGYSVPISKNYDFLANCSQALCYVAVYSTASIGPMDPELRGQFGGVAHLLPSLYLALLAMLATVYSYDT